MKDKLNTSSYNTVEDENILKIYLKEINKIPLLSREDEDKYARLALSGDSQAREILLKANLRFVVSVAKKYQKQGLPLADLISEGNIGLLNAIEKYDPDRGFHFISYAVWWIRQSILKALSEKTRMIRLPLNRTNELVQIEKSRKTLQGLGYDDDEIEYIAADLGMQKENVADLLRISREMVSLETPIKSRDDEYELGSLIKDDRDVTPEDRYIENSLTDEVNKLLDTLSDKEAEILQYRYGLNGHYPMSLKDVAIRYNLTKERIRQIEKKALTRLQQSPKTQLLKDYIA
ncbi:MAG: RNA polymerase sigma factor RpoD/SigA [Spirochaetales bacterium]|nr:RNA polymerase sigma factor RpoD/SigA [Spirochaetales bacterium]